MTLCVTFALCFVLFLASSIASKCPVVNNGVAPNLIVSEVNEPGFGDVNNKYPLAMASFNGYVYVGTLNAPNFPQDLPAWFFGKPLESDGAKVFRGKIGDYGVWDWDEVLDFGSQPISTSNNFGVRDMLVVNSSLYFVTANHEGTPGNGVEVWQSSVGGKGDWFKKSDPGFGDPSNISGRSLKTCGGYLYVGVENRNTGAQLWRHQLLGDGILSPSGSWERVPAANNGFGNPSNYFISGLELNPWSPNSLYAGTLNGLNGMELWKITSCGASNVAQVGTSRIFGGGWPSGPEKCPHPTVLGFDLCITNSGALTLTTASTNFGPALFLGAVNYIFGASLFVSFDGNAFFPIFISGNGDNRLSYVWSMKVYKNRLYIGTFQRPNIKNFLDIPNRLANFFASITENRPVLQPWDIDPELVTDYIQFLESLGGSTMMPVLPGFTQEDIDLDDVVESGKFTLFSLDLFGFNRTSIPPIVTVTETSDSFGTCDQYGIREMVVYQDKLIIGSAGASSDGGALVFEAASLS